MFYTLLRLHLSKFRLEAKTSLLKRQYEKIRQERINKIEADILFHKKELLGVQAELASKKEELDRLETACIGLEPFVKGVLEKVSHALEAKGK
jgi:archaellum component FlaC